MRDHITFREEEVKTVTEIFRRVVAPGVSYETYINDSDPDAALYLVIEHHDHFGGSHFNQVLIMSGPFSKCLVRMNE